MFKFLFKQKEMKKTETSVKEQKDLSSKEKYDLFWNKLFYAFFVLTSIGIIYMIKDVTKFRSELISLNPSYQFSKYSDFLICIPLFFVILVIQYYTPRLLRGICLKVMKKAYLYPKNEKDRQRKNTRYDL